MCLPSVAFAQTSSRSLLAINNVWKYQQTTNFDGVNWAAPAFDDSSWPSGPALLYVETNPSVTPRNTPLTLGRITYYFRTHFQLTNGTSGTSLVFSNLIDDGAVFYLNGVEVQRVRMPDSPPVIAYATLANAIPPGSGDATAYDVFTLTGDALTNLLRGDNVLAVEVHQRSSGSGDIVWGAALSALVYSGPMTFTAQPTNASVLDGRPVSFTTSVIANSDLVYQWFRNGVAIPGATNRTYALTAAYPSHAGTYFLEASNSSGTLGSSNAILAVIDDFDPPLPIFATGAKDLVTISIPYTEALDAASATDTNHFTVLPGGSGGVPAQVLSATLVNQTNVLLVTTPRTARADYLVHIAGVRDLSSRSNTLAIDLPLRSVVDLVTVDGTTNWRFDDSGAEALAAWAQQSFDDSSWSNGPAVFYAGAQAGLLPELVRTTLPLTNRADTGRVLTYYFRLRFDFPGEPATATLRLRHIVDDGAVFYLNGAEVYSVRMPATRPLSSTNLAAGSIGGAVYEPATNLGGVTLSISNLSAGQNVLAVEVHQGAATSSDIALAATLEASIERFAPAVRLQIPGALSELAGVIANGGTATIDAPLPTNLVVTLASSASNSVVVPSSALIPAGATTVSFNITVLDDNLLNGTRAVVLSASASGYSITRGTVVLTDDEVATLTLTLPAGILEGTSAAATLTLDRAPTFAAAISLVSTNPPLSFPATVTIPAGATSVLFNVTATDDALVNGTRLASVTAQFPNWISSTAAVSVLDNESTNLFFSVPVPVSEGAGVLTNSFFMALGGIAVAPVTVQLSSSDPAQLAVPESVVIAAGQSNASLSMTVYDDLLTNGTRAVALSASASGFATAQTNVFLTDNETPLFIELPAVAREGDAAVTGRVFAAQAMLFNTTVGLRSSDVSSLTVTTNLVIAAGQTSAVFTATFPDDNLLDGTHLVTVSAHLPNATNGVATVQVLDNEATNLVVLLPASAVEGDGVRTNAGQVRLGGVAVSNVVVALTSTAAGSLGVPASVTIPTGASNVTFDLNFPDNALTDGTRTIGVAASAPGFLNGTNALTVFDNDPHHVTFSGIATPQYLGSNFTVTVTVEDISGRRLTNIAGIIPITADANGVGVPVTPMMIGPITNGQWSGPLRIEAVGRMVRVRGVTWPGQSNPFHVEPPPIRILNLLAQDLAVHPLSGAVLASVVSSGGYTNQLVVIDPVSGTITNAYGPVISPGQLEISSHGQFLYASISNSAALQRFDFGTRMFAAPLNFGSPGSTTPDFAIVNGLVDTVVVWNGTLLRFSSGVRSELSLGGVASPAYLASSPTPNTFYGLDGGRAPMYSVTLRFNANPFRIIGTNMGVIFAATPNFIGNGGAIYAESGEAVDANTLSLLGHYPGSGPVVVDSNLHRTVFLQYHGQASRSIEAYDRDTFKSLYRLTLPSLLNGTAQVNRFLRWGDNGFVISFGNGQFTPGQIWFVQSNLLLPTNSPADLVLTHTPPPPPIVAGSNMTYTLTVSNQGPGIATLIRATNALPANVLVLSVTPSSGVVTQSNGVLWWNVDELAAGASAALVYSLIHSNAGWHHNYAAGAASEADLNFTNNGSHLSTFVGLTAGANGVAGLDFPIADMLYDASLDRLLLSLGNTGTPQSNGIAIFNPVSGVVESFTPLGTRPTKLARSGDGQFLYVSLPDPAVVRRLTLPALLSNLQFPLGGEVIYGVTYPWFAGELVVLPDQPNAVAVSRVRQAGPLAGEFNQGVGIFDNGVLRSNVTGTCRCTYALEFAGAGTLSASRGDGTIDKLVVDTNGVVLAQSATLARNSPELSAASGLMYAAAGRVFDPESLQHLGAFSGADTGVTVAADAANHRVFFVARSGANWALNGYDTRTFSQLGSILLTNVSGTPAGLLRWGTDGLAFRTTGGQLFLVRTRMLDTGATADLAVTQTRSTSAVTTNQFVTFTATVTNVGVASAASVRFTNTFSGASVLTNVTASAGNCTVAGGTVTCDLGTLATGQGAVVSLSALSSSNGVITSLASANTTANETVFTNNTALTVVPVGGLSVLTLNVPTLDLAWDSARGRFLATMATNVPNWRDTMMSFDPETLAVKAVVTAGPDASRLVVSPDASAVYVGNYNAVQSFDGASLSNTARFTVGLGQYGGVAQPLDLAVAPNSASTLAVARDDALAIFDAGTQRSNVLTFNNGAERIVFGATGSDVFVQNDYLSGFWRVAVDNSGAALVYATTQITPLVRPPGEIRFAGGLIYNNYGGVIDPQQPSRVGTVPNLPTGTLLTVDEALRRVFYLLPGGVVQAYELGTLLPAGAFSISGISGTPTSFTRWGANGLAFRTSAGQLYLVRTSIIPTNPPADVALVMTATAPPHYVGSNSTVTITITNRGPNAAQSLVWSNALPAGVTLISATASTGSVTTAGVNVSGTISNLASGASEIVTVVFRGNTAGLVTSSASVSSSANDPALSNNFATVAFWLQSPGGAGNVSIFSLATKDLARDPVRTRLYASIGSAGGALANSILVLNPETGAVSPPIPVGSDPGRLAVSADGSFLYVGLDGGGAVQRVNLATLTPDFSFPVPNSRRVLDMAVSPTNAELVALYRETDGLISVHEHGVPRPGELGGYVGLLAFSDTTADLYTCNGYYSGIPLYRVNVGANGVTILDSQPAKQSQVNEMKFGGGLLYFDAGMVVEPITRRVQAMIPTAYGSLVEPDAGSGRVFIFSASGASGALRAIDNQQWLDVGMETISGLSGSPARLLRWGANGLAFRTSGNQLFLVRSALVPTNAATDLALRVTAATNAVPIGGVLTLNLTVTNRGPSAAYNLVVTQGFSLSATSLLAGAASGTITTTTSLLTWTLSTLATNTSASCSVTVRLAQAGTLMTRAAVTHPANDPALVNNLDWEIVTVGPSNAVRLLPLMANELVFDPMRSRIYASVPASESFLGNSVAALDADTGELLDAWFVGSQPNQIALSDDGHFLHVGLDGRMSARRIDLTAGLAGLEFPFSTGLTTATDLEVQPEHPEVVAAALLTPNNAYPVAVRIYDSGVWRSNGPAGPLTRFLEFSPDGQKIYGAVPSGQGFGFVRYNVAADGLYPLPIDQNFSGDDDFEQDNGLLYRQSGVVMDPVAALALYTNSASGLVAPDSSVGRVFYLGQAGGSWILRAIQTGTYRPAGTQTVAGVQGTPGSLIRSGADRFAFRTSAGQVLLLRSPLVPPAAAQVDVAVTQAASQNTATLPSDQVVFTVTVSNAGPGVAAFVQVTDVLPPLVAAYAVQVSQGSWTPNGAALRWQPGTLAAGASATLQITLTITNTMLFTNLVHATPDKIDLNLSNNTSLVAFPGLWFQPRDSVRRVALATRDLAYDRQRGRIFASLAATNPANQIVWLNAVTAAVEGSITLAVPPDRLAISDDGQYLYVSSVGGSLVQRILLASNLVDFSFNLLGSNAPSLFIALPGHPHTLVASSYITNTLVTAAFDDGVPRPSQELGLPCTILAASSDGGALYAYANAGTGGASPDVFRYQVNGSGLTFMDYGPSDTPWGFNVDMTFASGRLYFGNGNVINPASWIEETAFPKIGTYPHVEINSTAARAIFLGHDGSSTVYLGVYDQLTRRELALLPVYGVLNGVNALTQCGADRVAFRSSTDVFILRTSQIPSDPPADLVLRGSVTDPTHTIGNPVQYTLTLSNAGPNAASNVIGRLPMSGNFYLGPVSTSQGTNRVAGGFLDCNVGTLVPGGQAVVSITITGAIVGTLTNIASVFSDAVDPNSANNFVTLTNALALPQLSITDVAITEGNVAFTNAMFVVSHNAQFAPPLSVSFAMTGGTASASNDFVPITGTLNFGPGTNALIVAVPVHGDTALEPNETFFITLSGASGATIAKAQGTGTILNDDGLPGSLFAFTWSAVSALQGSNTPFNATITARDAGGAVVSGFNGTAALRTLASTTTVANADFEAGGLAPWTPLNAGSDPGPYQLVPFDTTGSGQLSRAFRLTPNNGGPDGLRQYVELRGGVTYSFDLDAAQTLEDASYNGGDTEVHVQAAGTEVCAVSFNSFGTIGPNQIFRTSLHGTFLAPTNGTYEIRILIYRPWGPYGALWGVADNFRITPLLATPLPAGITFTNGVWAGQLRLPSLATEVFIRSDDGNGHLGDSGFFSAVPAPAVRRLVVTNGAPRLEFTTQSNLHYQVQFSSDLVNWQNVVPLLSGTGGLLQWVDPDPPLTQTNRFYRITALP